MRYIAYIFYGVIFLTLVLVATANRTVVELSLLPKELSSFSLDYSISVPIYLIFFSGTFLGTLLGVLWEWSREYKHRAELHHQSRELRRIQNELSSLKDQKYQGQDKVLVLLDEIT